MSATEVIDQVKQLPLEEQRKLFVLLAEKIMVDQGEGSKRWFGKKLSFEEACNVVFRENRELLEMLAK